MLSRLLMLFFILATVTGADAVSLKVTSPVSVKSGSMVTLGEMASITGASAADMEELARIPVVYAPLPGNEKKVDLHYVKLRIKSSYSDFAKLTIDSPDTIVLRSRAVKISGQEIASAAKEYMLSHAPQDGKRYEIEVSRVPSDVTVPEGNLEIKVDSGSGRFTAGPRSAAVSIWVDGKQSARAAVMLDVKAFAEVLVAKSAISRNDAVSEANTSWEMRDVTRISSPVMKSTDLENAVASRSITSGSVITSDMLTTPAVVESGSNVIILVKGGNVKLSARGVAMQSGRTGDTILVKGPFANSRLRAVVVEPGLVEVRI